MRRLLIATLGIIVVIEASAVHQLAQLLLPDNVVTVWDQILSQLGHGVGDSGVGFCGRRYCRYLNMQIAVEVSVLGILGAAQFLFFDSIAHRVAAQDGHLAKGLLLKAAKGVALGPQQFSNEVELNNKRLAVMKCASHKNCTQFELVTITR